MAKPTGRAVVLRACENHRGEDPELLTMAIMAALKGHGLHITADPAAAATAYCGGECYRVQLRNGRCPVCGWTPKAEREEEDL